jgi:hypothetical protein
MRRDSALGLSLWQIRLSLAPCDYGWGIMSTARDCDSRKTVAEPRHRSLLQLAHEMLGMLLMLLEELEGDFQQALNLTVLRGGDQRRSERSIDGLMIGDFVLGIGFVKGGSAQFRKLFPLLGRRLGQGFAGIIVLLRHLQLAEQGEQLSIHCHVIPDHLLGEGTDRLGVRRLSREIGRCDVDQPRQVGNMGDLRSVGFPVL